jgi:tetratricopeptide (TPR) repeat protein
MVSLAKLFDDMGDLVTAIRLYTHGLQHLDPQDGEYPHQIYITALQRLASIYKHADNYPAAVSLWQEAAGFGDLDAYVELAKYYEHRLRDYPQAIYWTRAALVKLTELGLPSQYHQIWLVELEHRLERLERKQSGNPGSHPSPHAS